MKLLLLAALTLCLLLSACDGSPAGVSDQSSMQPAPGISSAAVHLSPADCQALQDQMRTLRHLLQLSRAFPGDDFDPQGAIARLETRASWLKQLSQAQMKLTACFGNTT